ncbi:MAG TPA: hypothetical protein DD454_00935, partial [Candidatus Moranbacteria bacterium]|nr:hypothetical protein [Candidatus Moranbacteria bacterium]
KARELKKYNRWPNYEVLEIITDEAEGLVGLKVHYSNGSCSLVERRENKTEALNVSLDENGVIFNKCGNPSDFKTEWLVDGKPFLEKRTRYNKICEWKPIVCGDSDKLLREIDAKTKNKDIRDCLFYILSTGHMAIEFILKSNEELSAKNDMKSSKIFIDKCNCSDESLFIYDCTVFLNSSDISEVKEGLNYINDFLNKNKDENSNLDIFWELKYTIESKIKPDSSGRIRFNFDDPRSTFCVSDLKIIPNKNWNIKKEWVT